MAMDPVQVVVGAVCQGAVAAVSEGTSASIVSAYKKLRSLLAGRSSEPALAERHEQLIQAIAALYGEVARNADLLDDAVLAAAREISDNYHTTISDSRGVI